MAILILIGFTCIYSHVKFEIKIVFSVTSSAMPTKFYEFFETLKSYINVNFIEQIKLVWYLICWLKNLIFFHRIAKLCKTREMLQVLQLIQAARPTTNSVECMNGDKNCKILSILWYFWVDPVMLYIWFGRYVIHHI